MPRECDACGEDLSSDDFEGHDKNGMSIYKCTHCGYVGTNDW